MVPVQEKHLTLSLSKGGVLWTSCFDKLSMR
jgi:hypothetical protein